MGLTGALFILAFLACCVFALRRHPIYGAMTYVAIVFVDPPSRWWGEGLPDLRWSLSAAGVTLLSLLIHKTQSLPMPLWRHAALRFLLVIIIWAVIQWPWAVNPAEHKDFIILYVKYAIAVCLIYKSVENEQHLTMLMRTYVAGCLYLAWVAFSSYRGGRFDSFGGAGIGDANAGALTLATGVFVAAGLSFRAKRLEQIALALIALFLVNSMVMTGSRSGFLAIVVGGLAFNWYTPPAFRKRVMAFSVLGVIGFVMLANPFFWARIQTVKYKGEDVEGLDTGGARRNLIFAQAKMFKAHPFGCGHLCTETLSPQFLTAKDLSLQNGKRSSHNTFLSMLVDQGIVGGVAYFLLLASVLRSVSRLKKTSASQSPLIQALVPAISACLAAQFIGDLFVPYVRYEVRYWLLTVAVLMLGLIAKAQKQAETTAPASIPSNGVRAMKAPIRALS